jgi:hypothetical protein
VENLVVTFHDLTGCEVLAVKKLEDALGYDAFQYKLTDVSEECTIYIFSDQVPSRALHAGSLLDLLKMEAVRFLPKRR